LPTTLDSATALVLSDLQHGINALPTAHPAEEVVARCAQMADAFRTNDKCVGATKVVILARVESTARAANEKGYERTIVTDAVTDTAGDAHLKSVRAIFPRIAETWDNRSGAHSVGAVAPPLFGYRYPSDRREKCRASARFFGEGQSRLTNRIRHRLRIWPGWPQSQCARFGTLSAASAPRTANFCSRNYGSVSVHPRRRSSAASCSAGMRRINFSVPDSVDVARTAG
jgi:hypothetical protein